MLFTLNSGSNMRLLFNATTMKFGEDAILQPVVPTSVPTHFRTNAPKTLKIMLGTACNFRCKYCRQDAHSKNIGCNWTKKELDTFIASIKKNLDLSNLHKVEYWGGEPLLYWDTVSSLMDRLEDLCGRSLLHHLTTNGSLLTDKIVDKLRVHDFQYKLSHDGPGQKLRSGDPLAVGSSTEDLHYRLYDLTCDHHHKSYNQNFNINAVLTALCPSPKKIVEWFKQRFDSNVQIRKMEPVIPYNKKAASYGIALNDLDTFQTTMFDDIYTGDIVKNVIEYQELWQVFQCQIGDYTYRHNPNEGKCHKEQQISITTDRHGNITPCQVYGIDTPENVIGKLTDLKNVREDYPYTIQQKDNCRQCPVVSLCRGVCPYIAPGPYEGINCTMRWNTYMAILRAFVAFKYRFIFDSFSPAIRSTE